jgi:hypothetical protein
MGRSLIAILGGFLAWFVLVFFTKQMPALLQMIQADDYGVSRLRLDKIPADYFVIVAFASGPGAFLGGAFTACAARLKPLRHAAVLFALVDRGRTDRHIAKATGREFAHRANLRRTAVGAGSAGRSRSSSYYVY